MADKRRHAEIMDCLALYGTASVHRLAKEVHVSEATIRRDLTALEKGGYLHRTFGGAVLVEMARREVPPYTLREQAHTAQKNMAARRAAALAQDGDMIFMDASSTVYHLISYLAKLHDITVVTNGPKTSLALGTYGIKNYCTGGELLSDSASYVGKDTCDFFRHFHADIVFFSSRGIREDGMICDSSIEESQVREVMLKHAKKQIFVFDSSKLGADYRYNICHLRDVDETICEFDVLPDPYEALKSRHTQV